MNVNGTYTTGKTGTKSCQNRCPQHSAGARKSSPVRFSQASKLHKAPVFLTSPVFPATLRHGLAALELTLSYPCHSGDGTVGRGIS